MATRRLRALLAVAALAVAGCGDDEEEPVEGTGYSYSVPEGWEDVSEEAEEEPSMELAGLRPDSLVVGEQQDGYAPNVNVVREPGLPPGVTARQYARANIAALRDPVAAGFAPEAAETIERLRPMGMSGPTGTELGGQDAAAWEYTSLQRGRALDIRQVAAVRNRSGYTVTFTVPRERYQEAVPAFDEVRESWQWD